MFEIFKDTYSGAVERQRFVDKFERKFGIGPIKQRDRMLDAALSVIKRHDLVDELFKEYCR